MTEANGKEPEDRSAFDSFKELTRKLVSVPKKEIDKKETAYQRKKAKRSKRPAAERKQ